MHHDLFPGQDSPGGLENQHITDGLKDMSATNAIIGLPTNHILLFLLLLMVLQKSRTQTNTL